MAKEDKIDEIFGEEEVNPTPENSTIKIEDEIVPLRKDVQKEKKWLFKQKKAKKKERHKEMKKYHKNVKKKITNLYRYDTDPINGLPNDLVEQRKFDGLVNDNKVNNSKSYGKIFVSNIFTFFNILMVVIAAFLISVGAIKDLVFLVIVTANVVIGIFQEIRAKKTIDKLSLISAPTAVVIRDGVKKEISVGEIVLDDLLILETGKQISSDAIVIEGVIEVNESLLTGESDAIIKRAGDTLYSGSFVVSGSCKARVDKVGKDNYIEELTSQAKKYKKPKSDLLFSLRWIIRVMAVFVVVLGISLFSIMYFKNGIGYSDSVRKAAGAMIGMIPSGLFLATSIALAVGVVRLAAKNVLVQELYCIEMLARVNCICLDKTGTITDGTMSVKNVIDYNQVSGLQTKNIVSAILNALHDQNMTSKALEEKFGLGKRIPHIASIPFSSKRKFQAVTFEKFGTFILGAPEFVLKEEYKRYQKDVEKYAAQGYRVLALAHMDGMISDNELPEGELMLVSMILIEDNIRPDAIETIKYFKESQVSVRVISGDNPVTVSKISQRAGIENADQYISLDGLTDDEVVKAACRYTVFGRVSPEQKKLIIKTLKSAGLTVAMTGDGVNDILALREADCSIAVASGSEAARNVSHLVLLDSNFGSMPYVVAEGRRVINNVTSIASLFLTKTIFSLLLAIMSLQTGTYPISTNQLILIDLLAIGLPSLVLVMEPNNNPVKGKFLSNVIRRSLPGALVILMLSIATFLMQGMIGLDSRSLSTIIVVVATHTCLMVLFKTCKPFNTVRKILCSFSYSMFILAILFVPQYMEFRPFFSVVEYQDNKYSEEVILSYPKIQISQENYYVVDGKITDQYKGQYETDTINLVCKEVEGVKKYAISDTIVFDTAINTPSISYSHHGEILLGGYLIDNVNYREGIENEIKIDSDGTLYISAKTSTGMMPVKTTLTKTNDKYGFVNKYGQSKKTVEYNVMPTLELKGNTLIINGETTSDYKYSLKNFLSIIQNFDTINPTIEYNHSGLTDKYELLINGDNIFKVETGEAEIDYTNPDRVYTIDVPYVSNNSGQLYIGATNTNVNIIEVFGEKGTATYDGTDYTTYTIYDSADKTITYVPLMGAYIYDGTPILEDPEDINSDLGKYVFMGITRNFNNYKYIEDDVKKDIVVSGFRFDVKNGSSSYYIKDEKSNKEYTKEGINAPLSNYFVAPIIETTANNHYIIDDYYTEYVVTSDDLNPHMDSEHNLVLGGKTTDYKINDSDITTSDHLVKRLSVTGIIFLLMLCLLSAPLMKFFDAIIPWIRKQIGIIQKLLSRF